jgi:NAD-dependent deacetylase
MEPTWEWSGDPVDGAAARLVDARRIVVFTGAGVSTDSGIPDFRSPDGIWRRYDPRQFTYQRYVTDPEARRQSWRLRREFQAMRPRPNPAHHACARLAEAGRLEGVVTQNIDGLHGDAGLDPELICELHGNARWVVCLSCGDRIPMAEAVARVDAGEEDPACQRCGGILKATTVSFGQSLPPAAWSRAEAMATGCDAFITVGSSLVVHPAALLPELASEKGATLVIINREPTPLDPLADFALRGECGVLLPALVDALLEAT